MSENIVGISKLIAKLDDLENSIEILEKSMNKNIKLVQNAAKENCTGFKYSNGRLANSIISEAKKVDNTTVQGKVSTNLEYATYVEFGTGPNGEAHHQGTSPNVHPIYKSKGWIIPASAMDREIAENYGFGVVEDKDGNVIGYKTKGQYAHPFMYPALKDNIDKVIENIANDLKAEIEKVTE